MGNVVSLDVVLAAIVFGLLLAYGFWGSSHSTEFEPAYQRRARTAKRKASQVLKGGPLGDVLPTLSLPIFTPMSGPAADLRFVAECPGPIIPPRDLTLARVQAVPSAVSLSALLHEAKDAHTTAAQHGMSDTLWPEWYGSFMANRLAGMDPADSARLASSAELRRTLDAAMEAQLSTLISDYQDRCSTGACLESAIGGGF